MSLENFERFRQAVLDDPALHKELRETPPDEDLFLTAVVRIAASRGFEVTLDDAAAAFQAAKRSWIERWLR
jgi:predicted ribosomally synthesized peptide with nif11-like leader